MNEWMDPHETRPMARSQPFPTPAQRRQACAKAAIRSSRSSQSLEKEREQRQLRAVFSDLLTRVQPELVLVIWSKKKLLRSAQKRGIGHADCRRMDSIVVIAQMGGPWALACTRSAAPPGRTGGRADGRTGGRADGRTDGQNVQVCVCVCVCSARY